MENALNDSAEAKDLKLLCFALLKTLMCSKEEQVCKQGLNCAIELPIKIQSHTDVCKLSSLTAVEITG